MLRTDQHLLKLIGTDPYCYKFEMMHIEPQQNIIKQATLNRHIYIINSGTVKCYLEDENGKTFVQEFFGLGELFGEVELFQSSATICGIMSLTRVELFRLPATDFFDLLDTDPTFNRAILNRMAEKIAYKAKRHAFHQLHTVEENLQQLLKEHPDALTTIPKLDIASYLGVELRSLNRVLRKF